MSNYYRLIRKNNNVGDMFPKIKDIGMMVTKMIAFNIVPYGLNNSHSKIKVIL